MGPEALVDAGLARELRALYPCVLGKTLGLSGGLADTEDAVQGRDRPCARELADRGAVRVGRGLAGALSRRRNRSNSSIDHIHVPMLPRVLARLALAIPVVLAGCNSDASQPPASPRPPPYPPGPWPPAPPAALLPTYASPVYAADDAVRDALSSPLALVWIGGWTGYFRHLSCIYRNGQVIVVDMRCNKRETYQFEVIVASPARGRVEIVADAQNKSAALSTVQRGGYGAFNVEGAGPWAGPPQLYLGMSYDDIAGYHAQRSRFQGGCGLEMRMPQAACGRGAAYTREAFAAANARFLEAPPDDWYGLVSTLVAARAPSYASVDLGKVSANQLAAWGGAVAFQNDVDISDDVLAFVGQRDHFAAAVTTDAGGMAYAGTRRAAQIVIARTDRTGARLWESVLSEPGIVQEDGASVVAIPNAFYVHAKGYVNPALKARHRLVKVDGHGKVLWKWHPPDRGPIAIPQFFRAQVTPQGTVLIDGYIQTEKDGPVFGWTAEVSAEGKTLRDEVGSAELGKRNSLP
ncbi:MAG TPA: hypothetical protein VH137_00840 [Gemmatimonadales bacterium]|nr:hypothetical protein [Gemmatimonadales bacterium]